ncbi:hypothetical protein AVEN_175631-2-1, partial [Araneus ventricosus]
STVWVYPLSRFSSYPRRRFHSSLLSYRYIDKTPPHALLRQPNRLNGHGTVSKDRPSDKIPKNVFSGGLKRGELSKPLGRMFDDKYIVTNIESRFPAMRVLWLGREFYKVKHGVTSATLRAPMTLATNG